MKYPIIFILATLVTSCWRSEFEQFAYDGCIKEGRYSNKICSCNAKNLDEMLQDDQKLIYKKAALGDIRSNLEMFSMLPTLNNALVQCAEEK